MSSGANAFGFWTIDDKQRLVQVSRNLEGEGYKLDYYQSYRGVMIWHSSEIVDSVNHLHPIGHDFSLNMYIQRNISVNCEDCGKQPEYTENADCWHFAKCDCGSSLGYPSTLEAQAAWNAKQLENCRTGVGTGA